MISQEGIHNGSEVGGLTTKEYLNRARQLDARINSKLEQIARLRARAEKCTASLSLVPGGGNGDRFDLVARIADRERKLDADIDELLTIEVEIERVIEAVPDTTLRTLLDLRYLAFYTWDRIAQELHLDRRWVTRLHGRALTAVENTPLKAPIDM